jgi:two-component system, chemotaxis family, CheB/CheR fusion protein
MQLRKNRAERLRNTMKRKTPHKRLPVRHKGRASEVPPQSNSLYVVGIGASAGGLDALEKLFQNMPERTGMAFIVVSHLDPNHVSIMPELLQRSTTMKLFQAEDGMTIEPDHVYVAPANRDLAILHGTIQLIEPLEAHGFRLPIDFFFKSLAADLGEKAICIILSGMASDGTAGLKAVKSELGMIMVQDPASAKFDGMPTSAIKTQLADYILPPEEMPDRLIKYAAQKGQGALFDRTLPDGKIPDTFQKLFILLRNRTGHDFSQYKQNTIYRRVERRVTVSQLDGLPNYIRMLQENPAEIESLFRELLIGVTTFFRDPEAFTKLKKVVLDLVKGKPDDGQIRIWVPGCSTGEEAYSLAMIVRECLDETKKNLNVQIFGTDIDSVAIDKARMGSYVGIASDVSKDRLSRFFTSKDNIFHVRKDIREMLVFAQQSVIKDPPFTKLDLIACRNLLIYFSTALQKKIIPIFHYSLLPNGILFLGSSETISVFVDLFSVLDSKWKLYKRRETAHSSQPLIDFPVARSLQPARQGVPVQTEAKTITRLAEQVILQSYSPNCVILSANGDIVYIHGRTGRYLELPHGEARLNIFDMAREGLQQELPALIRKVLSTRKSITARGIRVKSNTSTQRIDLTVKPITQPHQMSGFLLAIFEDSITARTVPALKTTHHEKTSRTLIRELERELRSTKDNLRSAVEELETSNEELKSSNEEMQSTNEEMQSSNEELETSKEELQSLNEELITVNTELQNKNDELSVVNNDMKNLLDSTDIPTIFLDNTLRIKRFTFHATKVVNLISSDVGRPIGHLAAKFKYDKLTEDAAEVLRTLASKQIDLQTHDGIWYQMRILPYRTTSNAIDGVVITFSDVHRLKTAYEEINTLNKGIETAREYAENIIGTVRESLLIIDKDFRVLSANRSFYRMFNADSQNTVGKSIFELDNNKWDVPRLRELLEQIIPEQKVFEDYAIEYDFVNGGRKTLLLNARQMFHGGIETTLILLAMQLQGIK